MPLAEGKAGVMFGGLEKNQLEGAIEALLFVTDEPVNVITLAEMIEVEPSQVQDALASIAERLESQESGIQLQEIAGGWRLYTHPAFHELLEKYVLSWDTRRLTQAALETLAIIAYGQPITRASISSIRGVNSDSPVNTLIEKGLVRESGQLDAPGNPMTYSTTRSFLEKFGLRSVDDLPPLEDFAPDEQTAELLAQSLSAHGSMQAELADDLEEGLYELDPEQGDLMESMRDAMRSMVQDAIASSAGVVEKIDFEQLEFEE